MSQALITLFRTAFAAKTQTAVKTSSPAVRVVSAADLRQVVGGADVVESPNRGW